MKQHISVEQIKELTDEQMERLKEWWQPQDYDIVYDSDSTTNYSIEVLEPYLYMLPAGTDLPPIPKDVLLPLLSIGQMIELITEEGNFLEVCITRPPGEPHITLHLGMSYIEAEELADALWEAVKAVL